MPRVIHFEISVDDPETTKKFYQTLFEWKIEKWGAAEYWLIETGKKSELGIDGALRKRSDVEELKNENTINTIGVHSIDDFMRKVEQNGGKILMPKQAIPGIGYFTYCKDTEGNAFGIMEADSSAK
jgi:predicted enzyme related to lactoylglutathione lyase